LKRFAPEQPERLRAMAVRFVSPALPGDTMRIEMFGENDRLRFRALRSSGKRWHSIAATAG
jgi:hypothetical protein